VKESLSSLLRKFLIWKYKHISERNFVFMLSALIGLVATVYDKTTVRVFMTRPPETINYEKDSMQKVMQRFQDSGAWNLPVLKAGKYAGFVSKSKLLTAYRRELINFTN